MTSTFKLLVENYAATPVLMYYTKTFNGYIPSVTHDDDPLYLVYFSNHEGWGFDTL